MQSQSFILLTRGRWILAGGVLPPAALLAVRSTLV